MTSEGPEGAPHGFTERIRFVLVAPRSAGNVGSAARALKNLGFRGLVLVAPRCDPRGSEARGMAVDAIDVLEGAEVHETLDGALAGAGTVVGTSRRTGKQRRPHWRLDELAGDLAALARAGDLAFVFGRERCGLEDAELDRCTHLVHFLASEEYPSYNLGQSVLLTAYQTRLALTGAPPAPAPETLADHETREAMFAHLERALRAVGFLRDDTAEGLMRRIRRVLGRAALTPGDAKVIRGIARQVLWVAGERDQGEDR
jgi:tRNA (cytidine32/uridine32-2'-O)-methyltransferase